MQFHQDEWIITFAEMDAIIEKAGLQRGSLDVLPPLVTASGLTAPLTDGQEQQPLSEGENHRQLLEACLSVLANPKRVVRLHYTVADSTISRSILATSDVLPGIWVSLAGSTDPFRLSLRSDPELRFLVHDILAAETAVHPTQIGCDFSTAAALVLLAALDQARRSWLVSLLRHLEPVSLFSLQDIKDRLAESAIEDFRWVLPLVEKLLPIPVRELFVSEDPRSALLELVEAGLIEPVNEEATVYDWTEAGRVLADGDRQAASRLVLSQSFHLPEGEIAHDVVSLIRTPLDLFLFLMSGAEASMSTLLPGDLAALLEQIFASPLSVTVPAALSTEPDASMAAGGRQEPEIISGQTVHSAT
ncbi:MAG: hypothetical protein EOM08_05415 [Clostridia bacterium]|nr:hypothetical protein [Clostridia bacterium]